MDGCNGHRLATQTATARNRPHNLYILGTTATDYHNTVTTHHNTSINFFAPQPCRGHNRRILVLPTAIFDCMITRAILPQKNYRRFPTTTLPSILATTLLINYPQQQHCSSTYPQQQHCSSTIHNNTAHQLPTTTSLTAANIHPQPCHTILPQPYHNPYHTNCHTNCHTTLPHNPATHNPATHNTAAHNTAAQPCSAAHLALARALDALSRPLRALRHLDRCGFDPARAAALRAFADDSFRAFVVSPAGRRVLLGVGGSLRRELPCELRDVLVLLLLLFFFFKFVVVGFPAGCARMIGRLIGCGV
jgi:hypothetical protein